MAVRKVYGSLNSPATLKVLACLFEHDLDFEFVPVNLNAGEHKKKPFLSMNVSFSSKKR
jgi:glutathione S-transferase